MPGVRALQGTSMRRIFFPFQNILLFASPFAVVLILVSFETIRHNILRKKNHNVLWRDLRETSGVLLEFDGMSFQILSVWILDCQHGLDRHKAQKIKNTTEKHVGWALSRCYS